MGRSFLIAAGALLAVAGLSAAAVVAYATASAKASATLEVRQQVADWLAAVVDAETGVRGYIASGDPAFLEPYATAVARERRQSTIVRRLVAGAPAEAALAADADRHSRMAMNNIHELVVLVDEGQRSTAIGFLASGENKRRVDAFREDCSAIRDAEARALHAHEARARAWARMALLGTIVLTVLSCTLLVVASRRERQHDARQRALADLALRRLEALSAMAAALADTRTRAQVAAAVIEQAARATGADTCTLHELDEAGALELVGERGVAPEIVEKIERIGHGDADAAAMAAMRAGRSFWVEDAADFAKLYPALATAVERRPRTLAFWSVPLVAEGRTLGLLSAGYHQARPFAPDERDFVETVSQHCAQALLRASRLEREDEARQWLVTTLTSIGDGVIATDAAGRVSFMNPVAQALTGWSEAEARCLPLEDVFHILSEEDRQPVESPVAKVLRGGTVVSLGTHTLLRSRDGREIPVDDSGAPIRAGGGRIAGVVLVFRDGSVEKRARVQREFLARAGEALVASLDEGEVLSTVAHLAVPTLADCCAVDLVAPPGSAPRQVAVAHRDPRKVDLARKLGECYPPDPAARAGVPAVIRTGKSELYPIVPLADLEREAKDDEQVRLIRALALESAMVVPLRARARTFGALTLVCAGSGRRYTRDDLSFAEDFARRAAMSIENALAHKEAEAGRLREQALRSEAELANRSKDEFLATVSHELRTPLTAISGWVTLLRRRGPPLEIDRGLIVIERNARLQTKLIDDVLDISRIISGKLVINVGPASLGAVVGAAVETVMPAAAGKGIRIETELPSDEITISADADRLQQVVWNLLTNAVKFTPKGGRVTVRFGRDGSDVWITIEDSGEGIRPALLPALFEPFRQADSSTTRQHGGLGLGLAIVKQIVLAHGGAVKAHSEGEGRGSTFTVRLPTRAVVPVISRTTRGAPAEASASAVVGEVPRLDDLCVLLVDDEQDALELVGEVLRDQGAEVHGATSARQALHDLGELHPDVLVSDIGMPEMDGMTLIQSVRARPAREGGETPAIALTAFARPEDVERALSAGFQKHIAKPVEIPELVRAIAAMGRHGAPGTPP
jgi:PAS domain S-box-containing protein